MNVYDKAIAVIEARGWIRNTYRSDDGVCATYALMVGVAPEFEEGLPTSDARMVEYSDSCEFIRKLLLANGVIFTRTVANDMGALTRRPVPYTLVGWNDMVAKDADEVIHLFKEASEAWDLEHPE